MEATLLIITGVSIAAAVGATWFAWRLWREERLRSEVRIALLAEMARPAGVAAVPVAGELFHADAGAPAWPRRLAIAAAMFAAVSLGLLAFRTMGDDTAAPTAPVAAQPLELLSLGHARESGLLVVTGRVQNPREGATLSRIVVTAALFDAAGAMIAGGHSPLDVARLEPGDESPFAVRIDAPAGVTRYRVSFRAADGSPLAHVDRRDPALARKEAP